MENTVSKEAFDILAKSLDEKIDLKYESIQKEVSFKMDLIINAINDVKRDVADVKREVDSVKKDVDSVKKDMANLEKDLTIKIYQVVLGSSSILALLIVLFKFFNK